MRVVALPILETNICYLIYIDQRTIVIDPGESEPIKQYLINHNRRADIIINTHHHHDHTGGNTNLSVYFKCPVYSPSTRISNTTSLIKSSKLILFDVEIEIIKTPGHTKNHICIFFPAQKNLFSGDCLFYAGCGRIFDGTHEQMYHSLSALKQLNHDITIYPGHNYANENLRFSKLIEPDNTDVDSYIKGDKYISNTDSLETQLKINPFLRLDILLTKNKYVDINTEFELFCKIRKLRDSF
jgi:hydroxyacylglutathione hydrolase